MSARTQSSNGVIGTAAILGALAALVLVPRARTTVAAEVELAMGRQPGWLQASWASPPGRQEPTLTKVLQASPEDVELHVAAATLLRGTGEDVSAHLADLARRFPHDASIRAHQVRHLTRSAIWIKRAELADFNRPDAAPAPPLKTAHPAPEALRQFEAAAEAGGRLEPANGFFDAMLAVGRFAAGRDEEALRHLHEAAAKPEWDDHATDETRAQWRLLQLAHGDRGALQKSLTAASLLLPHFAGLRQAARMAVWHAARRERAGDGAAGRAIRESVMRLGLQIADQSPLLIGKAVGAGLFTIGTELVPPERSSESFVAREVMRKSVRERYAASLTAQGDPAAARWVRTQGERMDGLNKQVHQVLAMPQRESFFSPLRLLSWWVFGVVVLKQIAAFLVLWGTAVLLARMRKPFAEGASRATWTGISLALLLIPPTLIGAIGGLPLAWNRLDAGLTFRLAAAMVALWGAALWWTRHARQQRTTRSSAGVWIAIAAWVLLLPFILVGMMGSMPFIWISLAVGLGLLGLIGLARWAGRRSASTEARPRWQPALVALMCVLPSALWVWHTRYLLAWDTKFRQRVLGIPAIGENVGGVGDILPLIVLFPVGLLAFVVVCRVAVLDLPVRAGVARGLRQTVPWAIGLLASVYLATLVPTVAEDRRADYQVSQALCDELKFLQQEP